MKRYIIIFTVLLIAVIASAIGLSYLTSTHVITVKYDHAHEVVIIDDSDSQEGASAEPVVIRHITKSGESIRIPKDSSYSITYKGDTDYSNGVVPINNSDSLITINPDYSSAKYQQLLQSNSTTLTDAITKKYPTAASLYTITPQALYDYGNWALVLLVHKGEYSETSDTLKIILHKSQNNWILATKPDLVFNKFTYPDIPQTILDNVNDTSISY